MTYSHPMFVWVGVEQKGGFTYQDHSREEQDASNNLALTKPILNRALWYFKVICHLPWARQLTGRWWRRGWTPTQWKWWFSWRWGGTCVFAHFWWRFWPFCSWRLWWSLWGTRYCDAFYVAHQSYVSLHLFFIYFISKSYSSRVFLNMLVIGHFKIYWRAV